MGIRVLVVFFHRIKKNREKHPCNKRKTWKYEWCGLFDDDVAWCIDACVGMVHFCKEVGSWVV